MQTNISQWRYDQTTATYLLLLSKKQRGKPVRLRPEPPAYECSPSLQGTQVRLRSTAPTMLCSLSGSLTVVTARYSGSVFIPVPLNSQSWTLFFRLKKLFTPVRMRMLSSSVPWTFAQNILTIARGLLSHNVHPSRSEVSQTELQTPQTTKTWYVELRTNL